MSDVAVVPTGGRALYGPAALAGLVAGGVLLAGLAGLSYLLRRQEAKEKRELLERLNATTQPPVPAPVAVATPVPQPVAPPTQAPAAPAA
jgi:hypothetical protein